MVAQLREPRAAAPVLEVMPAMPALSPELPPPTPLDARRKVVNTILCRNALCKLPLCEVTKDRAYRPIHAAPLVKGATITVECPSCHTVRVIEQR